MKKVSPGQPLEIPASAYNAFVDAALDYRSRALNRVSGAADELPVSPILVRNASGAARGRFDILGISAPLVGPATNLNQFQGRVALVGVAPNAADHADRFVVLLEPAPANQIVRACAAGVCVARVRMVSESHTHASPGSDPTMLVSGFGAARLLWIQPPGERAESWAWCVIRIGELFGVRHLVRVISDGGETGTATTAATWTYSLYAYTESDTQPSPLPTPLATARAPQWRATIDNVGAWNKAPDWSVGLAEYRPGYVGNDCWRLLFADERLPVVVCDPGTPP